MKTNKLIIPIVGFLCVVIFCIVAVSGRIYSLPDLPLNFMSAFLGAIITSGITLVLLRGQSNAEEVKERNVKIFDKKSSLFEEFSGKLYSIIDNQKLSVNDYNSLKSDYYTKIMLYLNEKSQKKINSYINVLGYFVGINLTDGVSDLETVNLCYTKIKENVYSIINILVDDIGLGGKIDINSQKELDDRVFPQLFKELLLEEINKTFINEEIFNKARYMTMANGTFLVLNLNGKFTIGGGIHIGPFFNFTANEKFPAYDGIFFRFFKPVFNPLSELYAVNDGTNYNKTLIDFQGSENGLFNLQAPLESWAFKSIKIESDLYNGNLDIIRFDDIKTLEKYTGSIYINIVKAIAARTYFFYLNAKTKQDNITIKELFDKFENIAVEQFNNHTLKILTTSVDFSK